MRWRKAKTLKLNKSQISQRYCRLVVPGLMKQRKRACSREGCMPAEGPGTQPEGLSQIFLCSQGPGGFSGMKCLFPALAFSPATATPGKRMPGHKDRCTIYLSVGLLQFIPCGVAFGDCSWTLQNAVAKVLMGMSAEKHIRTVLIRPSSESQFQV